MSNQLRAPQLLGKNYVIFLGGGAPLTPDLTSRCYRAVIVILLLSLDFEGKRPFYTHHVIHWRPIPSIQSSSSPEGVSNPRTFHCKLYNALPWPSCGHRRCRMQRVHKGRIQRWQVRIHTLGIDPRLAQRRKLCRRLRP